MKYIGIFLSTYCGTQNICITEKSSEKVDLWRAFSVSFRSERKHIFTNNESICVYPPMWKSPRNCQILPKSAETCVIPIVSNGILSHVHEYSHIFLPFALDGPGTRNATKL